MKFKCMQCGAAPCFLENEAHEKDPSPFAITQPDRCPYHSPIMAQWELMDEKKQNVLLTTKGGKRH